MLPRHKRNKFYLDNRLENAKTILEQEIRAIQDHALGTEALENLTNTCKLYIETYPDALSLEPQVSWATQLLSQDFWSVLRGSLALAEITPNIIFETLDFNSVISAIFDTVKARSFVRLVAAIGFKQLAER